MKFIIKSERQYSSPRFKLPKSSFIYKIRVDESWVYDENIYGKHWNKLIGNSDAFHHHSHSNRLAWRCVEGKIELCHYVYQNGERYEVPFRKKYNVGDEIHFSLRTTKNRYIAKIGKQVSIKGRTGYMLPIFRYFLKPYFGGKDVEAPHDIIFEFKRGYDVEG